MNQSRTLYATILLLLVSVTSTLVLADVVFTYNGKVITSVVEQPIEFGPGSNANAAAMNSATQYEGTTITTSNAGFTVTAAISNAASIYYYDAVQLTVNQEGYIYLNDESISGSAINTMYVYIAGGTVNGAIEVIAYSSGVTTPTTGITLPVGTYEVSIKIIPNLPVTSTSLETVTLRFGYNVISSSSIPVP